MWLKTLAVASFVFALPMTFVCLLVSILLLFWFPLNMPFLAYLLYISIDNAQFTGSRTSPGFRNLRFVARLQHRLSPIICSEKNCSTNATCILYNRWFNGSAWISSWWVNFREYFPITLYKTKELKPDGKYIFGYHPHGIIGLGAFSTFATNGSGFNELFPGIRVHLVNR